MVGTVKVVTTPALLVAVVVTNGVIAVSAAWPLPMLNGAATVDPTWVASPKKLATMPGDPAADRGTVTVARPFEPVMPVTDDPPMVTTICLLARGVAPALSSAITDALPPTWPAVGTGGTRVRVEATVGRPPAW